MGRRKILLAASAAVTAQTAQHSSELRHWAPKHDETPEYTSSVTKTSSTAWQCFHDTEVMSYQLHSCIAQPKFVVNLMTTAHQIVFPWLTYSPAPPSSNKMELPTKPAVQPASFGSSRAAALATASSPMVVSASPQQQGLTSWPHSRMDIWTSKKCSSLCQRPPFDTNKSFHLFQLCLCHASGMKLKVD